MKKWVLGVILVLVLSPLIGTVYTYTRAGESARVYAATANTLNFQARLMNSNGSLVNDGSYSVEFRLYDAVSGGTIEWTGTYSVTVKNGYLSAYLGSGTTPFSASIDWSQEKWLTMNVNGDGEMAPRIKLTAVPYAFRSGQAASLTITGGTVTGDNLLQKAPSSVQSLSSANAGLRFNQTGAGGLIQLQGDGVNVFTVDKAGNGALAKGLTIGNSSSTTAGTLRWSGLDFEGYTGSGWVSLTATGGTTPFVQSGNALGQNAVLGTTDNYALRFITNNTEKFTILANGNIGVGDTTPTALFTVGTNDALQISASGNLSTTGTVTSGAINGQDIDATANLTGTLGVAGLTTLSGGLTIEMGDTFTFNGEGFTDLTGTGLTNASGVLSLANTTVTANSYGSSSAVPTFTVDAQGRLTAAGTTTLANSALQNSSIGLSYGTNLSGNASVVLGGTLNINFSATPTFTSVTTGTVTNAGALNLTATGAGNDIVLTGADRVDISAGSTIELLSNTNLTGNFDVSGSLSIGTNDALKVDANGSLTTTFRALDGSTTATSASGITPGTINVVSSSNFDVGNYVLVNSTYAKITAKTATTLTITPSLTWANGATVTEYYVPEIGGTNIGTTLTNRFGRGYFIAGVVTGNGTTYYNEDSVTTSLTTFNLLNENVSTLNIGGSATTLSIGNSSSTVSILGSLQTSANETITAGGGLVVNANGIDLNSTGVFEAGAISGATTISASGAITAATSTNTINGLIINSGALSGVTGITFSSGGINLGSGGITNAGSIGGVAGLTLTSGNLALGGGSITGAGSIAGTSLGVTGVISAATTSNTINGLIINSGSLSGITGFSQASGAFSVTGTGAITLGGGSNALAIDSTALDVSATGALSGITTISASGAITGATATNTINGLIINSGSLSGITGFTQTSGNFSITGTGTFSTGTGAISLNGATSVTGSNTFTVGTGATSLGGALTTAGSATFNGNISLQTGDTFTINGEAFTDLTGAGLILNGAGSTLTVDVTTAGTVAGTGSNSGLVVAADGVSLLRGCANNQILKWSTTGPQWNCAADNTGVSDARLKKNVETVNMDVLSRIRGINLYSFDYDCSHEAFQKMHCDTEHQAAGVMAQELRQVFPELVTEVNGFYQVHYDKLGLYNLKAVGELADRVDNLALSGSQNQVVTNGVLRLSSSGVLQNITGLNLSSGGASIVGGLNNNGSGITAAGAISGVTNISARSINLNATDDQNLLTLTKDGNGVFTVFNSGALELKLDSANAFAVKSANGDNALNVDTLTGKVKIGSGNKGKTVLFVLDNKNSDGDPTGVNGAQYYNSKMKKFRCYQDDRWQDCLQTAFSEYMIASGGMPWMQPSGDHELPGENRTWVDLSNANQARLLMNISAAGSQSARCHLQYSPTEDNPDWKDLTDIGSMSLDKAGAIKGDWLKIKDDAKKEVLIRVFCSGGNGITVLEYTNVRTQIR